MLSNRQQILVEQHFVTKFNSVTYFGVTVFHDNIELTVTIEDDKNKETTLDLVMVKQLIGDYLKNTDKTNFDDVIYDVYDRIGSHYWGRDIEIIIYDTVECLTIMKTFKIIKPAI